MDYHPKEEDQHRIEHPFVRRSQEDYREVRGHGEKQQGVSHAKQFHITGKLYSSEFNQNFEVKRSVCSIREDENGKFDFNIDGVSHVSWFRRKRDEFREAIGIPKTKQNRGIKY